MKVHKIEAKNIPDAWFQCVYDIFNPELTWEWTIDQGSYAGEIRREFKFIIINIENPCYGNLDDRLVKMPESMKNLPNPTDEEYVINYFYDYLFSNKIKENETYTYGYRLLGNIFIPKYNDDGSNFHLYNLIINDPNLNPMIHAYINEIKNDPFGKGGLIIPQYYAAVAYLKNSPGTNQVVLQIAQPSDLGISDPPCLRGIDCRVRDGKLHWVIYFRSWDLWSGLPSNLAGLSLLMEQMCEDTGYKPGSFVCESKGLHLYKFCEELAKIRLGRTC